MGVFDYLCGYNYKLKKSEVKAEDVEILDNHNSVLWDLPKQTAVDIEFQNVTLTVSGGKMKDKKQILKGVSGQFRSGELTAIMGPSGAGKTSLLNVLTGFSQEGAEGVIKVAGTATTLGTRQKCLKSYRKQSCYILQDDRLNPLFTVEEIMTMAANFKLGNAINYKSKQLVISDILETLGLTGTANTRCERLSGGQRKRLSVALELIDNPPVIFLDEPTTGLDSSSSMQCVELLKNLAGGGRTVICTIHQPTAAVYELFDRVFVLAEGYCIYEGSSENTVEFLAQMGLRCPMYHNPADFLLEVANREYGNFNEALAKANRQQDWCSVETISRKSLINGYRNLHNNDVIGSSNVVAPPNELYKLHILVNRCLIQLYRDWTVTHLKVLLHVMVGIVLGIMFVSAGHNGAKTFSNIGYLMITVVYLCYTTLMPAVVKFPQELPVLKKENFNNWYNLNTYYVAALLTNTPLQILFSFVYCGASYFLSGQPLELSRFVMFVSVCSLVSLISDAIGNIIGTCLDAINGTFLGAILACTNLVFAGYLVLFSHMSSVMLAISQASFMRYAMQGLIRGLYGYGRLPLDCPDEEPYCHLKYPKTVLQLLSMEDGSFWSDICFLCAQLIFFRIVAYFTLARSMRRSS